MTAIGRALSFGGLWAAALWAGSAGAADAPLPEGVRAVWNPEQAFRQATPARERLCLNGLWRWQPAPGNADSVPEDGWGFFKVPGAWPGITDYLQKDCQTVFAHPQWKNESLGRITSAWYQREFTVPDSWAGRRIALAADYVNSLAAVFVDGKPAGDIHFPAGEVDLTERCRPGRKHLLSLRVDAIPLKGVLLSYSDSAAAREVKGQVARRGLCGDLFLIGTPAGPSLAGTRVATSTRRGTLTFEADLRDRAGNAPWRLRVQILDGDRRVAEFTSPPVREDHAAFTETWRPDQLWDLHTPQNVLEARFALLDAAGKVLDEAWPVRFGFREFWIDGRDFQLNGSRVGLSVVPLDNAQVGAAWSTYAGARESLLRLQGFGINCVYTHNYDCQPGAHLAFDEILRAADDVGMLVALAQPHFSNYDWTSPGSDATNGYARHAAFYTRVAGSHPSVVMYAMSHNATGYNEDMNPDLIDGIHDRRDTWAKNNVLSARRAEALVRQLDPGRIIYHHSSGNLGTMHQINFYPNFVPVQELSDWFEHWATEGVKPLFLCEYGAPFSWDWTMYRGWYKGERSFGSARVPWEFCFAEWNAQFLGDRAFRIGEPEKKNLRWEAEQFRAGRLWHRWDYPYEIGSTAFDDRYEVHAMYLNDNWRAFRTWGVAAFSPWEFGHFWKLRDGLRRNTRTTLPVDWDDLQRPGFSPDYLESRYERMDLAYERADWIPTPAARALLRNNRPLLAYLAGAPGRFTSKDHIAVPGETVEKQVVVINNSRLPVSCECSWSFRRQTGSKRVDLPPGRQARVPLRLELPSDLNPGTHELLLTAKFDTGEVQEDAFALHVLAPVPAPPAVARLAVFDPKGETWAGLGQGRRVEAGDDLSDCDVLVIGKGALSPDGPGPDLARVRDGLKVLVFEQTAGALEKRLGFRVAEYGLRQVVPRVPDHPLLSGLGPELLRDWRGEATLLPPRLAGEPGKRYNGAPTVRWCDLEVTRLWRCGCRGNVASVLIEKPARGDFLPLVDGGYSLQYSPLLEYREGRGLVLFCQMDVTGRTETDPAAGRLLRNLLDYVATWKPGPARQLVYAGDPAGQGHLEAAGFAPASPENVKPSADVLFVAGPGGGTAAAQWLRSGGRLLGIGLGAEDVTAFPFKVELKKAEHIASHFEATGVGSPFAGLGPADVHIREPRVLPLAAGSGEAVGDGVLATCAGGAAVLCQLAPWKFDYRKQFNLKRTFRRSSCLVTRLLCNSGVPSSTPLLGRFAGPAAPAEKRWLSGLYLDVPEEMDDPYRFFRW